MKILRLRLILQLNRVALITSSSVQVGKEEILLQNGEVFEFILCI